MSTIINCYKEKKETFKRALDSIEDTEIIVSTVKGDPCVNWSEGCKVVESNRPGIFYQLNNALKHVTQGYFTYSSATDQMLPGKVKTEQAMLKDGKKICYSAFNVNGKARRFFDCDYKRHLQGSFVSDCAMIDMEMIEKYGPFREEFDTFAFWDFYLRVYEGEGDVFVYNDRPTWDYFITPDCRHQKILKDPVLRKERMLMKNKMLDVHRSLTNVE